MRKILSILAFCISFMSYSQIDESIEDNHQEYSETSKIKIVYTDNIENQNSKEKLAYFINGKNIENIAITNLLSPDLIESVNVEKGEFVINDKKYHGKIHIKTKKEFNLENTKPITLKTFISKYLPKEKNPSIFLLDGELIQSDESEYLIHENHILKIEITRIQKPKFGLEINYINLITRSKENIEKTNQILIR